MDKASLIQKLKAFAKARGKSVVKGEFIAETGISHYFIKQHFRGWRAYCKAAGVKSSWEDRALSEDELFAAMKETFLKLGGITSRSQFFASYRYCDSMITRRLGGWTRALINFRKWCDKKAPDFPYLALLPTSASRLPTNVREMKGHWRVPGVAAPHLRELVGDRLDFRAMARAPLTETGVVALFGMIAQDLGFEIEALRPSFPDCEARRRVAPGRWRRVAIEFELKSANFKSHGHDVEGCDLIVCWEHNWPGCPLEVIELKSQLEKLRRAA
jgi:hypothetical protein